MKKILLIVLSILSAFSLIGCSASLNPDKMLEKFKSQAEKQGYELWENDVENSVLTKYFAAYDKAETIQFEYFQMTENMTTEELTAYLWKDTNEVNNEKVETDETIGEVRTKSCSYGNEYYYLIQTSEVVIFGSTKTEGKEVIHKFMDAFQ